MMPVLLFDEISMIDGDLFTTLEQKQQEIRQTLWRYENEYA